MKRIKLTVAYDGTHYSGWQIQPNAPTIEKELDMAIYALTGEKLHVTGASRTDAGVHGLGNVAVFDTESTIPGSRFCYALNPAGRNQHFGIPRSKGRFSSAPLQYKKNV